MNNYKKIQILLFTLISIYSFSQTNMERDLNKTNNQEQLNVEDAETDQY